MKVLKHGDLVTVNGLKGVVGTAGGYAASMGKDPGESIALEVERAHDIYWVNREATVLSGDPGYAERQRLKWQGAIPLGDSESVWLEGKVLVVGFRGDFSDMAFFADPEDEAVIQAASFDRSLGLVWGRVVERLGKGCNVRFSAYETDTEGLPCDNLDKVVVQEKVRFTCDWWKSDVLENPTWMDVAVCADAMITATGDLHHVFLEGVKLVETVDGVQIMELVMGS